MSKPITVHLGDGRSLKVIPHEHEQTIAVDFLLQRFRVETVGGLPLGFMSRLREKPAPRSGRRSASQTWWCELSANDHRTRTSCLKEIADTNGVMT